MNAADHVLIAVRSIEQATATFRSQFGLNVLPGGSPFPGVVNAIIPLAPPAYLELVSPIDPSESDEAADIAAAIATGDRLYTWAIEPDSFEAEAERLGEDSHGTPGSGWRTLGGVRPDRPFFIEYSRYRTDRTDGWQKRYDGANHPSRPGGLAWLELGGDEAALRNWIGEVDIPLRFVGGAARLAGLGIAAPDGEIVIRDLPTRRRH